MTADNSFIADQFSLLAKLTDVHGGNSFKAKAYSAAAFTIDKLPQQLAEIPAEKYATIKGIGDSAAKKIVEILETGEITDLTRLIEKTPPGVLQMMNIKGIGPKKVTVIWKEMGIETVGELLYACNENRLTLYKGFGEKTQKSIQEAIEYFLDNIGSYLYAQVEKLADELDGILKNNFSGYRFFSTGIFRRQMETIDKLEWVTNAPAALLQEYLLQHNFVTEKLDAATSVFQGKEENILLYFYHAEEEKIFQRLFETSCSEGFLEEWNKKALTGQSFFYTSEEEIFEQARLQFVPPYLREAVTIIEKAATNNLPAIIQPTDIKAIIHSHSKWSDGNNTIEEMANAAIKSGLEYLVISDHSKTAVYANGLTAERLKAQHAEIDELNEKLKPFKIFKSIESDILGDGSLDYDDDVLASFDIVIASVHSNLKMNEEKAMMRLLNAIKNPFTSILGHCTGRLLLSRAGYPVNHKQIIDACAVHNVVVELNANPRRLDMDWRYLDYCTQKNVLISINPDAHSVKAFQHTKYGVLAAQKAGITAAQNLSSFPLNAFESFLKIQQAKRGR
ncbi:helix-hairpin-helix domain-containing protein [Parafilimonas terrae]|uniref:DNA polymerase (Family 10) n=1 Tax=Parafilimonas terrae TaxID=1465490 RepID=A0A1I5V2L4_9BACT|nr:helix-hairpin-helix domain-containing protein [Parafilimonas terrae]SFQ01196.1 DNA polymerase (family 10) [Parafilimonas terrae]